MLSRPKVLRFLKEIGAITLPDEVIGDNVPSLSRYPRGGAATILFIVMSVSLVLFLGLQRGGPDAKGTHHGSGPASGGNSTAGLKIAPDFGNDPATYQRTILEYEGFRLQNLKYEPGVPLRVKDSLQLIAKPSVLVPGAISITVVKGRPGDPIDVLAILDGKVVSVKKGREKLHPGSEELTPEVSTVQVQMADGSLLEYGRLTEVRVEPGQEIAKGSLLGRVREISPLCLRVCFKSPGSERCVDPRPLMLSMLAEKRTPKEGF